MVRLGDVFERQITGEWGSECLENETGTNILRTTNFTSDGVINYNNVVVRSIEKSKVESKRLHYGDIILEKSGGTDKTPVGRVVFCDPYIETGTYLCNNFTQAMRVNPSMAVPKYVFYFMWNLHWSGKTELMQNKTTGIRNLQVKSYLNQALPLPSLDEQRRIAAMLDKVTDLISKRRQQLDKLDELVKARFVEMFGTLSNPSNTFKYDKLENLCRKITDGKHGGCTTQDKSGRYFVGAREIFDDLVHYETAPEIRVDEFEKDYQRCNVEIGDMLIVNTGATIGKSAIASDPRTQHTLLQKSVALLKVKPEVLDAIFLQHCYKVNDSLYKVENASAQPNLLLSKIKSTSIYVPPIELQKQFSSFAEQAQTSKFTIGHSLEKLETLKKALMQKYFE